MMCVAIHTRVRWSRNYQSDYLFTNRSLWKLNLPLISCGVRPHENQSGTRTLRVTMDMWISWYLNNLVTSYRKICFHLVSAIPHNTTLLVMFNRAPYSISVAEKLWYKSMECNSPSWLLVRLNWPIADCHSLVLAVLRTDFWSRDIVLLFAERYF